MNNINNYIQEKLKVNSTSKVNTRDMDNWTIKTAEDGDIVSKLGGMILFMYKGLNGEYKINTTNRNTIVYHAYYIADNRKRLVVETDTGVGTIDRPEEFKLATDEQCEEFYKALKDNGYKWDEIKKEIIKL